MPDGLVVILDEMTSVDWEATAVEQAAVVLVPESRMTRAVRRSVDAARNAFGRERVLDTHQAFTPQILADAVRWLRERKVERIELRADPRHFDIARIGISLSREPGIVVADLNGVRADSGEGREIGVLAFFGHEILEAPDWETVAAERGACVIIPQRVEDALNAWSIADAVTTFKERRVPLRVTDDSIDAENLQRAIAWLRKKGTPYIEVWADPGMHREIRALIEHIGEDARFCDIDGQTEEPEKALMQQRSKTTSTLLIIAADAVFTEATKPVGPFEQLIVDEVGWDTGRPIMGARALAGWERRVTMLCGAVRPGMTAVIASPHPSMRRAAIRMLSAVPFVGMKDAKQLEEWDSDCVINFAGRVVENAKERGGRGPQRIVIVVRENDEFVEDALSRAAWMLDEARVEIMNVDPQLGLLEGHVTSFWSEEDAAAHAANLQAILAERENTEPF